MGIPHHGSSDRRRRFVVEVLTSWFAEQSAMEHDAFVTKFRKMAADPFAFYRGSACLFYADVAVAGDDFADERTSRVWIQGDLHAENFGTYMNADGRIVLDVNDFDEACIGPFTWDLKRLSASLVLLGIEKALSDDEIAGLLRTCSRTYVDQMHAFRMGPGAAQTFALTRDNARGPLIDVVLAACASTRLGVLDGCSTVTGGERRFRDGPGVIRLSDDRRAVVEDAFCRYFDDVPRSGRTVPDTFRVKDVVGRRGVGIGSAGLASYNAIIQGPTEAFEDDVLLYMKQAGRSAPAHALAGGAGELFDNDAHRIVVSQRALQRHADPWLGYTMLDDAAHLVAEVSPYCRDLNWSDINDVASMTIVVEQLGRAVAKIHSVADEHDGHELVPFCTDEAITQALDGREEALVDHLVEFGFEYACTVTDDHRVFVDEFRNHRLLEL